MSRIAVYGAGRLGGRLVSLLSGQGRKDVYLLDASEDALDAAVDSVPQVVLKGSRTLDAFLAEGDIVVAASGGDQCLPLAVAALRNRCHYIDFNESPSTANSILKLEGNGISTLVPSCGFSPGLQAALISDFASEISGPFDLNVYAGVIPRQRVNRLGYGLVMNIDGLLQEYLGKALIKQNGAWQEIEPLTLEETIVIDGEGFEAFVTGGTTNELPRGVAERVRSYAYRTLRYPGHLDYIRFLLEDLKLRGRRDLLSNLLRNGLPVIETDQAIIHLSAMALAGKYGKESRHRTWRVEGHGDGGVLYDIAAKHGAAIIELMETGVLAGRGPVRQEDLDPSLILSNPQIRMLFE
jgi:saccharopine dehydrogenase-like NADP-dependent oxidoreductase